MGNTARKGREEGAYFFDGPTSPVFPPFSLLVRTARPRDSAFSLAALIRALVHVREKPPDSRSRWGWSIVGPREREFVSVGTGSVAAILAGPDMASAVIAAPVSVCTSEDSKAHHARWGRNTSPPSMFFRILIYTSISLLLRNIAFGTHLSSAPRTTATSLDTTVTSELTNVASPELIRFGGKDKVS